MHFVLNWELGEEFVLDVLELGFESLSDLVFVLIGVLWLHGSFGGFSSMLKFLFSLELALEDLTHHFLFFGLQSLVVKCAAQRHHRDGTITVTDRCHAAVDRDAGQHCI